MRISTIHIENIRGIENQAYDVNLYPNKPSILVAPNGFGKSSIAMAFNSLNRNRLDIGAEDKYQNRVDIPSKLELIMDDGTQYIADENSNTISSGFSVFVINGQLYSKHISRNVGGHSIVQSAICISPITLIRTIPERSHFTYSYSRTKGEFGNSGKLLINLKDDLRNCSFISIIEEYKDDFARLQQARNGAKVQRVKEAINQLGGTKQNMIVSQDQIEFTEIENIEAYSRIYVRLSRLWTDKSKIEICINICQLLYVYAEKDTTLTDIFKYYSYLSEEKEIQDLLKFFNCTWKNIGTKKSNGQLILEFPNASHISNGERDILCFIGKLFEAKVKMRKPKSILIIDEVFDYLDDANLIAAQYFLSKYINQFNSDGLELYPIILTHLDPMYFQTYCFSVKNVQYLSASQPVSNTYNINNILKNRDKCQRENRTVYDTVSSYYLHYHTQTSDEQDVADYFRLLKVDPCIFTSAGFKAAAECELQKYRSGERFDVAFVCCGLRIYIEQEACKQLTAEQQRIFIEDYNKTIEKLEYAKNCGATISETHFLLSIIYNEATHLDAQCKKLRPITYKLNNKVIHHMICEI